MALTKVQTDMLSTGAAFLATSSGTNQSVTSGSTVTVRYGTEVYDRNSNYNPSTYNFVAPVSGMYQLQARLRVDGIAGGGTAYAILSINTTNQSFNSICTASGAYNNMIVSVTCYMAAGHTANVTLNSNGQTITAITDQPVYSDFSGYFVG